MIEDRRPPAAAPAHRLPALVGAAVTAGFEAGAIGFVLPAMRSATGASAQQASWLLSVFVAATLVGVPASALATRRWDASRLLRTCLAGAVIAGGLAALAVAGLVLAVAAPAGRSTFMAGTGATDFGVGLLSGGPLRYAAARFLPLEAQGVAQGAVSWITDLGLLGGSILSGHLAGQRGTATSGVELALGVARLVMALCALAMVRLPRHGSAAA